mmetsp:Transcript_4686/g.9798  ORF Transcript_4686/g.9798 Transcript_4686/m.9798 type:complete len:208 (-) Transcript_4686:1052-1675(-)
MSCRYYHWNHHHYFRAHHRLHRAYLALLARPILLYPSEVMKILRSIPPKLLSSLSMMFLPCSNILLIEQIERKSAEEDQQNWQEHFVVWTSSHLLRRKRKATRTKILFRHLHHLNSHLPHVLRVLVLLCVYVEQKHLCLLTIAHLYLQQQVLLAVLQATTNSVEETSLSTAENSRGMVMKWQKRLRWARLDCVESYPSESIIKKPSN